METVTARQNDTGKVHEGVRKVVSQKGKAPNVTQIEANIEALAGGMLWLEGLIKARMEELEGASRMNIEEHAESIDAQFLKENTAFFKLLHEYSNTYVEYLMISLCFAAWFRPRSLKELARKKEKSDEGYAETGIMGNGVNNRFIPSLQTVLFLLAGTNMVKQAYYHTIIADHPMFKDQVLQLRKPYANNYFPLDQIIELDIAYYNYLLHGKRPRFDETFDFPAQLLETNKSMDDLILKEGTKDQLQLIMNYARYQDQLFGREDVSAKFNPGMLCMLYGPPGTGKSFSVAVMSKALQMDAYRIDLSQVISKYIGETEKNLEKIFMRLSDKPCILFFDEADVLFGKRSEVKDAKDRYANQEVAYLLQRVENFPGLVILASNFKQNLDEAFRRRILVSIYMPPPESNERFLLWSRSIPESFSWEQEDLPLHLAEKHSFTGANISNVMKLACIQSESEGSSVIGMKTLKNFINMEYVKEGLHNRKA